MTREEAIRHWATEIVPAVFKAEDKLRPQLQQILKDHEDDIRPRQRNYIPMPSQRKSSVTQPMKS